jgi:hypothetical protein
MLTPSGNPGRLSIASMDFHILHPMNYRQCQVLHRTSSKQRRCRVLNFMVDHSCCSFYRTETECLENDPFQMTTFLAPEQLTDEPDTGYGYSADDIFAAGKEFDDDDAYGYYRRENYVGAIFRNFTVGDSFTCEHFAENYLAFVFERSPFPLVRNVYASALYGPAPTPNPTAAPTQAPTTQVPTLAPTLAPTPKFGLMGFDYGKSSTLLSSDFECMVDNGFNFFIQRGFATWHTQHHGIENSVDPNVCIHLHRANRAGLDVKGVFVQPWPRYGVSYATAVTSLKRHLLNNCGTYADIPVYLSVLENDHVGDGWRDSYEVNRHWIEGFLTTCKEYFHTCGVLSSRSAWTSLFHTQTYTNSSVFNGVSLWYSSDESKPNFKDFRSEAASFGGWSTPSMKQFVRQTDLCGFSVGNDWFN